TPNVSSGEFSTTAEKLNLRDEKFGLKLDLNTAHLGNWSGYYHFDDANFLNPFPAFTSNVPGFSAVTLSRAQQFQVSNTAIFNPNTVNEVRINYTRFAFLKNKPVGGLGKIEDFGYIRGDAANPLGVIPTNSKYEGVAPISLDNTGTSFGLPDGTTGQYNDTYKVSSNLTVNYGLRWDTSQPFYDTKDRIQTFVPGVQSKIYPDSPTGFVFPGDPGVPRTLAPTQYNRFAPRLGIAYSPSATE